MRRRLPLGKSTCHDGGGLWAIACRARASSSSNTHQTIEACWCLAHDHVIVVVPFVVFYVLLLVLGGPASAAGGVGVVVVVEGGGGRVGG